MMRSTVARHETAVGAFLIAAVLIVGGFAFMKTRERGLIGSTSLQFTVDHGSGLTAGAPVLMRGIQVGEVADIQLTKDNRVQVTARIAPRFAPHLKADATATVVEPPLLGSTKVELTPGTADAPPDPTKELATGAQQGSITDQIDALQAKVDRVVSRVDGVVAQVDSFVTTAGSTIESVQRVVKRVDDGQGLIGQLVNDPQMAEDAKAALKRLRGVAEAVDEGKGVIGMAVHDAGLAEDLKATAGSVRRISDEMDKGQGTLGKLLKDATLADETTGLVKDVRGAVAKLEELNGEARKLLDASGKTVGGVEGLLKSVDKLSAELTDTVKRVNTGEGTIASLLNDPLLYKESKSLLKELRETVEDLREQAPINSFLGVVFSAF